LIFDKNFIFAGGSIRRTVLYVKATFTDELIRLNLRDRLVFGSDSQSQIQPDLITIFGLSVVGIPV